MSFRFQRRIRFADTDAAGVVYFANYLSICHEAYEEAVAAAGIELAQFFSDEGVIIPVSNARCDYLRPLRCGDLVEVDVRPEYVKEDSFFLEYEMFVSGPARKVAARVRTDHVCINSSTRRRSPLPRAMMEWVKEKRAAPAADLSRGDW